MNRCSWVNLNNPLYVDYHDNEWGVLSYDDNYIFMCLCLEILSSGLSFECILNKREDLKRAFLDFKLKNVMSFTSDDIKRILNSPNVIRHEGKIKAIINNARVFNDISLSFNGFMSYLLKWTNGMVLFEEGLSKSPLSDAITKDLKRRGMQFIGSTTIYAFLQATGVIDSHSSLCFKHKKN